MMQVMTELTPHDIASLPKALLHDHLDGGLRVSTILELSDEIGHALPTTDPDELAAWFVAGANTKDLLQYLATFEHTLAVMQTAEHCARVAHEAAVDLATDGVAYAEVRFAPELHDGGELALDDVVEAVQDGFRSGMSAAAESGQPIVVNTIICAMRQADRSVEIAELAARWRARDARIVSFDLAGPETGFPPTDHLDAVEIARRGHLHLTLHASEPPGLELIDQALQCGAERIGHGVRLYDDIAGDVATANPSTGEGVELGPLARYILERQVHLEMAPSCHVHVGAVPEFGAHPIVHWHRLGFNVGVNTDNRLMSGVSVGSEMALLAEHFDMSRGEMQAMTVAAIDAGFGDWHERQRVITEIVEPAYAAG